jgi:hypothetical protein
MPVNLRLLAGDGGARQPLRPRLPRPAGRHRGSAAPAGGAARASESLKRSAEPLLVLSLLDLAGRMPSVVQELLVTIFGAKATAVFSNVPGPSTTLSFAGHPMSDIFFWVPQAGRLGLGVSILSYDGRVRMGVGTDAGLVPDPEQRHHRRLPGRARRPASGGEPKLSGA